jgi:hypothetical protein
MLVSLILLATGLGLDPQVLGKGILFGEFAGNVELHDCDTYSRAMIDPDSLLKFYRAKKDGKIISEEEFNEFLERFTPLVEHLKQINPREAGA